MARLGHNEIPNRDILRIKRGLSRGTAAPETIALHCIFDGNVKMYTNCAYIDRLSRFNIFLSMYVHREPAECFRIKTSIRWNSN